jgi:hypothetical protein
VDVQVSPSSVVYQIVDPAPAQHMSALGHSTCKNAAPETAFDDHATPFVVVITSAEPFAAVPTAIHVLALAQLTDEMVGIGACTAHDPGPLVNATCSNRPFAVSG